MKANQPSLDFLIDYEKRMVKKQRKLTSIEKYYRNRYPTAQLTKL